MYNYRYEFAKINDVSVNVSNINVGDKIPVGGTMTGALNLSLEIDKIPNELTNAFEKMNENAKRINTPAFSKWLHDIGTNISPNVYAHLFAFVRVFDSMFPLVRASADMLVANFCHLKPLNLVMRILGMRFMQTPANIYLIRQI